MSAVSRVRASAFAKRRKLNDESAATTSESDGPNSAPLVRNAKLNGSTSTRDRKLNVKQKVPIKIDASQEDSIDGDDENSFGPLVDAKVVSFIGTREVEWSGSDSCRIRLSKGQRCSLQGITRLWVREGIICTDGAVLPESLNVYTMLCTVSGSCTDIVAQSKFAEFQLESIHSSAESVPSILNVPGKLGEMARRGPASFTVLEQTQSDSDSRSNTTSDMNRQIQGLSNQARSITGKDISETRTLFCGKRSSDTYRAAVAAANHVLTNTPKESFQSTTRKVFLLDLDYLSPAFSAPGTISIALLRNIVLGTSYTQPLHDDAKMPNHILASHYIKSIEITEKPKLDPLYIQVLLDSVKDISTGSCIIIRTGSWFANTTSSEKVHLRNLLLPGLNICIDSNKSSPFYEAAQAMSTESTDTFVHLPIPPSNTSVFQEHKLLLQSHFRLHNFTNNTPLWHRDSLPDLQSRRLVFRQNDELAPALRFIQLRGGILRPQDIPRAIHNNLVVLVAAQNAKEAKTSSSPSHLANDRSPYHDENPQSRPLLDLRTEQPAQILHYISIAYVTDIDLSTQSITLNAPAFTKDRVQHHLSLGHELGLVLEKPGVDGRFSRGLLL